MIRDLTRATLGCVLCGCTASIDCQILCNSLNTGQHAESSLHELQLQIRRKPHFLPAIPQ
jgi:hypothetical protein